MTGALEVLPGAEREFWCGGSPKDPAGWRLAGGEWPKWERCLLSPQDMTGRPEAGLGERRWLRGARRRGLAAGENDLWRSLGNFDRYRWTESCGLRRAASRCYQRAGGSEGEAATGCAGRFSLKP